MNILPFLSYEADCESNSVLGSGAQMPPRLVDITWGYRCTHSLGVDQSQKGQCRPPVPGHSWVALVTQGKCLFPCCSSPLQPQLILRPSDFHLLQHGPFRALFSLRLTSSHFSNPVQHAQHPCASSQPHWLFYTAPSHRQHPIMTLPVHASSIYPIPGAQPPPWSSQVWLALVCSFSFVTSHTSESLTRIPGYWLQLPCCLISFLSPLLPPKEEKLKLGKSK